MVAYDFALLHVLQHLSGLYHSQKVYELKVISNRADDFAWTGRKQYAATMVTAPLVFVADPAVSSRAEDDTFSLPW